jgi:hypothetical protein
VVTFWKENAVGSKFRLCNLVSVVCMLQSCNLMSLRSNWPYVSYCNLMFMIQLAVHCAFITFTGLVQLATCCAIVTSCVCSPVALL